jgi:hypothetical protein
MADDETFKIDINSLRIREIEDIEEITGVSLAESFSGTGKPMGKVLRALGYVVKRRENPDFTLEQAGELVISLADGEVDPTVAAT